MEARNTVLNPAAIDAMMPCGSSSVNGFHAANLTGKPMKSKPATHPRGETRSYLGGRAYIREPGKGRSALTRMERAPENFEPWGRYRPAFDACGCSRAFDPSVALDDSDMTYTPVNPQSSPHWGA
jgi:hypothetical protein